MCSVLNPPRAGSSSPGAVIGSINCQGTTAGRYLGLRDCGLWGFDVASLAGGISRNSSWFGFGVRGLARVPLVGCGCCGGAGGCCITRYRESSEPVAEASLCFMWSHLLRENMEGWGGLSWEAAEPQGWSFILIKGGKKKKRLGFKSVPSH